VDARRILLGRGEKCHVRLGGEGVSRHHAELRVDGARAILRDLDSTNGTHINGERVEEQAIEPSDVVRLGVCVGIVVDREGVAPGHPSPFGEPFPGFFSGPVLQRVLDSARAAACADLPLIIEGETGTGKERVARAIHGWSGRDGPFAAINCAALPESLAEAELFGYRKGAFTGADRPSLGHFRAAQGGTLLLDEVADLPLALQPKVLRAIELREVVPLGETRPVSLDVRILAAAQVPLEEAVRAKRFRADLLARLDGVTLRLPPLRDRREEVPFLFSRLLSRHGPHRPAVDPILIELLCTYPWPFNVRELDLLARRMMALHGAQPVLRREHLPERFTFPAPRKEPAAPDKGDGRGSPADDERDFGALALALRECRGNVTRAAVMVGISRPRAYRLMRRQEGLDLKAIRSGKIRE
jgi:two-component system response regulator FlrC